MLHIEGISKTYGKGKNLVHALRDVHFQIQPGEMVGLIGPNGSGKSTLMRIIAMLQKPDTGSIRFGPYNLLTDEQAKQDIGFLSTETSLHPQSTPFELLSYFGKLYGLDRQTILTRIEELANVLAFQPFLRRSYGSLSSGNQQKVSLARALIHSPRFLMLDEPTLGLDLLVSAQLRDLLKRLKSEGVTLLISSHIKEDILICDRMLMMNQGQLVRDAHMDAFRAADVSLEDYYFATIAAGGRSA